MYHMVQSERMGQHPVVRTSLRWARGLAEEWAQAGARCVGHLGAPLELEAGRPAEIAGFDAVCHPRLVHELAPVLPGQLISAQ